MQVAMRVNHINVGYEDQLATENLSSFAAAAKKEFGIITYKTLPVDYKGRKYEFLQVNIIGVPKDVTQEEIDTALANLKITACNVDIWHHRGKVS